MDTEVRGWNRLAESGRRRDWRQERQDDLDVVRRRIVRWDVVGQVCYRSVILCAFVDGIRNIVATESVSDTSKR